MKATKVLKYVVSFSLAGLLLYFAFKGIDWKQFADDFRQTRWGYSILFFVVSTLAIAFRAERWRVLIEPFDSEVRWTRVWDAVNVSNMANVVLPGMGEVLRTGYMSSKRIGFDKVLGTLICERAFDAIAIIVIVAVSFAANWTTLSTFFTENFALEEGQSLAALWWIAAVLVAIAGAYLFIVFRYRDRNDFCRRNVQFLSNIWTGLSAITRIRGKFAFFMYTLGIWVMYILMSYFIFLAMPPLAHLNMMDALIVSCVGNVASIVPVPGGIGAYHYVVALCMESLYGASYETGLLYATLNHELHAVLIIALGLVCYAHIAFGRRKSHK